MKMKTIILLLSVLIYSCQSSTETQSNSKIDLDFPKTEIDSSSLASLMEDSTKVGLTGSQVRFLSEKYLSQDTALFESNAYIEFLMIDSLKTNRLYKKHLETIDIGMVKDASAFVLDSLVAKDGLYIRWYARFVSYEACPYSASVAVYISKIVDNKPIYCVPIGSTFIWSDPPMSYSSELTSILENQKAKLHYVDIQSEMGDSTEIIGSQKNKYLSFDFVSGKYH
jgi:hypothetical protein